MPNLEGGNRVKPVVYMFVTGVSLGLMQGAQAFWSPFGQENRRLNCGIYSVQSDPAVTNPPTLLSEANETFEHLLNGRQVFSVNSTDYKLEIRLSGPPKGDSGKINSVNGLYYNLSSTRDSLAVHGNWNLSESKKPEKFQTVINRPSGVSPAITYEKIQIVCQITKI